MSFLEEARKLIAKEVKASSTTIRELIDDVKEAGDVREDLRLAEERIADLEMKMQGLERHLGITLVTDQSPGIATPKPVKKPVQKVRKPS